MSIVFFRGSGLIHCWGGYAAGFAGPDFVEGLASRGFAARLWLRGVASPGFADACSTNISDICALMQLNYVESMRKGAMKAVTINGASGPENMAKPKGAERGSWTAVASRRLRGGFAEASRKRSIVSRKTGPETHSALPVVFL